MALIDGDDPYHARCSAAMAALPDEPLLTTWPCLTEAMYLLGRAGGRLAQDRLWGWLKKGNLDLHTPALGEWERLRVLMATYADAPMDLADASLVSAAEWLGVRRVFTVDRHFYAYRIGGTAAFEVVP